METRRTSLNWTDGIPAVAPLAPDDRQAFAATT